MFIIFNQIINIGCGFDAREWWDENTGMSQILTTKKNINSCCKLIMFNGNFL